MYYRNIKGDEYKSDSLNKGIGDSLSGKQGLADILAPSCLVTVLDIMFLLIHAARCKHHVALTSLIVFPLSCSQTTTYIHKHAIFGALGNELMSTTQPWLIIWIIKHGWYLEAPYVRVRALSRLLHRGHTNRSDTNYNVSVYESKSLELVVCHRGNHKNVFGWQRKINY